MVKENDQPLKFSEWRPIGVCDQGRANQRSARMFSRRDFEKICSPGVNRKNWEQIPQIRKLVERYALEVSRFSNLTKDMKKPGIVSIKLVGAVLGHEETPGLNLESKDGKVQLFQVEFEETAEPKKERSWLKYILFAFLGMALLITLFFLMNFNFQTNPNISQKGSNASCNSNAPQQSRMKTLKDLRRDLLSDLKRLPEWSRLQDVQNLCSEGGVGSQQQEIVFLRCLLRVRAETETLGTAEITGISRMERCAESICAENQQHLQPYCRRL